MCNACSNHQVALLNWPPDVAVVMCNACSGHQVELLYRIWIWLSEEAVVMCDLIMRQS